MSDLLNGLNDKQREAAKYTDGPPYFDIFSTN